MPGLQYGLCVRRPARKILQRHYKYYTAGSQQSAYRNTQPSRFPGTYPFYSSPHSSSPPSRWGRNDHMCVCETISRPSRNCFTSTLVCCTQGTTKQIGGTNPPPYPPAGAVFVYYPAASSVRRAAATAFTSVHSTFTPPSPDVSPTSLRDRRDCPLWQ